MDGYFLLNKSSGLTSFRAVSLAKKILGIKKVGHSGTLDPFATGLLFVCTGRYTKTLSQFIGLDKVYRSCFIFGAYSETYDSDGDISFTNCPKFCLGDLIIFLDKLKNNYYQVPPKYSAVKINGIRSCDRIRKGENFDLEYKKKKVILHNYNIKSFSFNTFKNKKILKVDIELKVSSGFYIRSLVRDIANHFNTFGLCSKLHRVSIGKFNINNAVEVDKLSLVNLTQYKTDDFDDFFNLDTVNLSDFKNGRMFKVEDNNKKIGVPVFFNNKFLGYCDIINNILHPKKVLF